MSNLKKALDALANLPLADNIKVTPQTLYVIMGNDYPAGIMSSLANAKEYCDHTNEMDATAAKRDNQPRIYWNYYAFEVDALILPKKG